MHERTVGTDAGHFTAKFHVSSDYTSGCTAEDCEYEFDMTGVHQE